MSQPLPGQIVWCCGDLAGRTWHDPDKGRLEAWIRRRNAGYLVTITAFTAHVPQPYSSPCPYGYPVPPEPSPSPCDPPATPSPSPASTTRACTS
jgi:hypothetical protein